MERDDTRHGRNGAGTGAAPWEPYRTLRSLRAEVTIQCKTHGSHRAVATGPYLAVLDAICLLREACVAADRWMIVQYTPSEEVWPMAVSEWE
jgi:hypothetical protein